MPAGKASAKSGEAARRDVAGRAAKAYEAAMKLFSARRDWDGARERWAAFIEEFAGQDAVAAMVDRARRYLAACEQHGAGSGTGPADDVDPLLRAVVEVNAGRVDEALAAVDEALAAGADRGRALYVRATALARAERFDEAASALTEAIAVDAEYRAFALGDPDFERFRETAAFAVIADPPRGAGRAATEGTADGTQGPDPDIENV